MPLIVFLLGMCLVGLIVYKTDAIEKEQKRTTAQLNATTYGERIKNEITNGIAVRNPVYLNDENGQEYFWGFTEEMIAKNPNAHYVVTLFDIDDFKFINDIYGHVYGDRALKNLADSMKISFPSDELLGRNGGDEFCILLPNRTYDDAKEQLQQFTMLPKIFSYKGNDYIYFIVCYFPSHYP